MYVHVYTYICIQNKMLLHKGVISKWLLKCRYYNCLSQLISYSLFEDLHFVAEQICMYVAMYMYIHIFENGDL